MCQNTIPARFELALPEGNRLAIYRVNHFATVPLRSLKVYQHVSVHLVQKPLVPQETHMAKYFCEFCNKTLLNDRLKSRRMHCSGAKHTLMKKAYYMELFEQEKVVLEMESILRDMKNQKIIRDKGMTHKPGKVLQFMLPSNIPPDLVVPKEPIGFKLPPEFDFYDRRNFPENIGESIRKYT